MSAMEQIKEMEFEAFEVPKVCAKPVLYKCFMLS